MPCELGKRRAVRVREHRENLEDGGEIGISFGGKRLVEALSAQASEDTLDAWTQDREFLGHAISPAPDVGAAQERIRVLDDSRRPTMWVSGINEASKAEPDEAHGPRRRHGA